MPRTKWRTVSCQDDSLRSHASLDAAARWVAKQDPGVRYRVQFDDCLGGGWRDATTVDYLVGGERA